jgi:hypothetical protein
LQCWADGSLTIYAPALPKKTPSWVLLQCLV